jgi:hypothetical protein
MLVVGNEAYLAGGDLVIVDVADPSQMNVVYSGPDYPFYRNFELLDPYLVAASSDGLRFLDITDPTAPVLVSEVSVPLSYEGGFAVSGDKIVIPTSRGLTIVDASVVAEPVIEVSLPLDGGANRVAASGTALISVPASQNLGRLAILDLEAVLEHQDCFTVDRSGRGIVVDGIHAYVFGQDTAAVYDISGSGPPSLIAESDMSTSAYPHRVLAAGSLAFTAEGGGGIGVYELDSVIGPQRVATFLTNQTLDLAHAGNTLLVADLEAGIQVIDVTTPSAPTLVRTLHECKAAGLVRVGNELFACDGYDGDLYVYDISLPTDPQLIAVASAVTSPQVQAIDATSDGLLIGTTDELLFVDITDPTAPTVAERIDGVANRILVDDNVAYVQMASQGVYGLVLYDVGSIQSPTVIGRIALPSIADIAVDDQGVYIVSDSQFSRFPAHCTSGVFAPDPYTATAAIVVYPNPFNMSTTIELRAPGVEVSNVSIYDVRGRLVRQLADERATMSDRTFQWDGRDDRGDVASGIYLVRVQSDRGESVQSVTLLK